MFCFLHVSELLDQKNCFGKIIGEILQCTNNFSLAGCFRKKKRGRFVFGLHSATSMDSFEIWYAGYV